MLANSIYYFIQRVYFNAMSQICIRHLSWDADAKEGWTALYTDTYTNIHKDTASMYPQLHPRHSRGSQAQKGVAMETRLLLSVPPVHRGQMIAPLISRDHNIHTHTPADSHAHTYTHMHHKYFHVHTVTSKNTHTLCIATQANKATILVLFIQSFCTNLKGTGWSI